MTSLAGVSTIETPAKLNLLKRNAVGGALPTNRPIELNKYYWNSSGYKLLNFGGKHAHPCIMMFPS